MPIRCTTRAGATLVLATLIGPAFAQTATQQQLQNALDEARQAAARAQAAAAAAEAALAKANQPAQTAAKADTPPSGLYFNGNLDVGYRVSKYSDSTRNKSEWTFNNSSTSLIWFKGLKRFSNDTTASFLLELDVNPTQSSTANGAQASNAFQGTPFQGEQWLALEGRYGLLKVGTPNSGALLADVTAQPFGTTLASGYVASFGRLGTSPISGVNQFDGVTTGRIIRHEKTAMYTTPTFAGLKVNAEFSPGNSKSASIANNNNRYEAVSLQYSRPALNTIYSYTRVTAGRNAAAGAAAPGAAPVAALPANTDIDWHFLAGNYTLGPVTVYGGYTVTKHHAPTPLEDSSSWNLAGKYTVTPSIDLMLNYVSRDTKLTTAGDASSLGAGLNYWWDKATNLYVRAEYVTIDAFGTTPSQKQGIAAAGLRYQF